MLVYRQKFFKIFPPQKNKTPITWNPTVLLYITNIRNFKNTVPFTIIEKENMDYASVDDIAGYMCWKPQNLPKERKACLSDWRETLCSWTGRLSIFRGSDSPQIGHWF